jgi:hypothetical protein
MTTNEIADKIFSMPKWYASIKIKSGFMNAQAANRVKSRFRNGKLSYEMTERIFNHYGYFIADKTWTKL